MEQMLNIDPNNEMELALKQTKNSRVRGEDNKIPDTLKESNDVKKQERMISTIYEVFIRIISKTYIG